MLCQRIGNVVQRHCHNVGNWRRHNSHFWHCHKVVTTSITTLSQRRYASWVWSFHQAQQWVRSFCNYKKLSFAGLRELEESTLATPTTINKDEYDGIHISNIKHNNKRVSIGHLNIQSLISSFNKFHWMLHTPVFVWYTDPIRNLAKIQQTSNQIKYVEISYH